MDTSDSECFESADESLQSDDDTTTVVANKVAELKLEDNEKVAGKLDVKAENESCDRELGKIEERKTDVPSSVKEKEEKPVVVQQEKIEKKLDVEEGKSVVVQEENNHLERVEERGSEVLSMRLSVREKKPVVEQQEKCEKKRDVNKEKSVAVTQEETDLWGDDEGWGNLDVEVDETLYDNTQLPADLKKGKLVSKYIPDEDKWEFDSWEPLNEKAQQNDSKSSSSWGDWSNWGVSSILTTATTLTSQVSQGLSNVLETGMGAPDPEELARINRLEQQPNDNEKSILNENNNSTLNFGFGNFVSGVTQITKIVETTSSKVINSSLDTLETIGKKTMEVLQEGDPGLKKKRAFLQIQQEKPVLSQILREAKAKAEEENKHLEERHFTRKANYESIFDDCQGLVHLEALEMLSRQCVIKLQTVLETYSGDALKEVQETMEQVKELCEIPDEDEEETLLSVDDVKNRLENAVSEIGIAITYEKLVTTWVETEDWLKKLNLSVCSERELHQQAIETLAQLTAVAVEQFHKGGELLLIKEHRSTADEADSLVQLTTTLTALIGVVAGKFSDKLNGLTATSQNKEEINSLITNIFLEAANSSSYIQDAFQLLIPVLQVGAI